MRIIIKTLLLLLFQVSLFLNLSSQVVISETNSTVKNFCFTGNDENNLIIMHYINKNANTKIVLTSIKKNKELITLPSFETKTAGILKIKDVAFLDDDIYICGNLRDSNKTNLVIKYNSAAKTWEWPFVFDSGDEVNSLISVKNSIVMAGKFKSCNGENFNNIVNVNSDNTLKSLLSISKEGVAGTISTLATNNFKDSIFLGGNFTEVFGKKTKNLAVINLQNELVTALKSDSLEVKKIFFIRNNLFYSTIDKDVDSVIYLKRMDRQGNIFKITKLNTLKEITNIGLIQSTVIVHGLITSSKGTLYTLSNDSLHELSKTFSSINNVLGIGITELDNFCIGDFLSISTNSSSSLLTYKGGKLILNVRNITALFFWDKNNNGTFENGIDLILPYLPVKSGLNRVYTNTNNHGLLQWLIVSTQKNILLDIADYKKRSVLNSKIVINLDTLKGIILNVPLKFTMTNFNDLKLRLKTYNGPTRGLDKSEFIKIEVENEGESIEKTDVSLEYNAKLGNINSKPPPDLISNGKLVWKNVSISRGNLFEVNLSMSAESKDFVNKDELNFVASVSSEDDYAENNSDSLNQSIVTNEIFESKKFQFTRTGESGDTVMIGSNDGYLDYTIRFVNTSADTVQNVVVIDSIDVPLFIKQVQLTSCSHNFSQYYYLTPDLKKLVLRYNFNGINLMPNKSKNSELANTAGYINLRVFYDNTIPVSHDQQNTAWVKLEDYTINQTNMLHAILANNSSKKVISNNGLQIWPNPISNTFNIANTNDGNPTHVEIYTMQGQLIYQLDSPANTMKIDASKWPNGMYLIVGTTINQSFRQIVLKE